MIAFSGRLFLLDIEGTVSPLAYVHAVMFPFARAALPDFLAGQLHRPEVVAALARMAADAGSPDLRTWCGHDARSADAVPAIVARTHTLMDRDEKSTGLKQLQGLVWERGFHTGAVRAVLFPDVAHTLQRWKDAGRRIRIYSSGSAHAQRLFFAHTDAGDLTPLLEGHHDTTAGPKQSTASYTAIANAAEVAPGDVLFLSDVVGELDAARAAGMQTALALRPGNREVPAHTHPSFHSLEEISL